jgi:hypothetical protein
MSWFTVLVLSSMVIVRLIQYLLTRSENKKSDDKMDFIRKHEIKMLIEEREERLDRSEMDEVQFWDIMDKIHNRSKTSFKKSTGVFKDIIYKFSPEELIQMDNLLLRLFREYINYDIYAASTIIFKTADLGSTIRLMNLLMTRGEVFFKNACLNPNLIIGKEFKDIDSRDFNDVIANVYFLKTSKLIPEVIYSEDEELIIPGEPWTEKSLPSRYEELWFAYY